MQFGTSLSLDELNKIIDSRLEKSLKEHLSNQPSTIPPKELLTRKQVANLFHITLPTIHKYSLNGSVKAYRMGSRVLYKPEEVENALTSFQKYKT
jgi:excisionase family DNA binding protein